MTTNAVKSWEGSVTLPINAWHDDPQPDVFLRLRRWQLVYPYPRNEIVDDATTNRTFRALFVENEYLRLTVLPELGCHLYSAFDKINRREVFHRCLEIHPGPLGRRGSWAPLGIEFNFPSAHSPSTLSQIDAVLRRNEDGSASIVMGDVDRVSRQQWSIALTLRAGVNAVEADVTLLNRTDLPQGWFYWANAAVPATNGLRYVLPIHTTEGHGIGAKQDPWPMRGGVDYSWHRNIKTTASIFGTNCREDFFGCYDVDADWGVAHVADYRVLPGKKLFDWGVGPNGVTKATEFSPPSGPYVEVQTGAFENQPSYDLLAPHRGVRFTERWLPLHGLKSAFCRANAEAAVALDAEAGKPVHVAVDVTRRRKGCRILLTRNGKPALDVTRDLAPESPFAFDVKPPRRAGETLTLEIVDPRDGAIVAHRLSSEPPPAPRRSWLAARGNAAENENGGNGAGETTDRLYARARAFDNMLLPDKARALYEALLAKDPEHAEANLRLGVLLYRGADCAGAARHFERALRRNPDLVEAHYYLGLAAAGLGDDAQAQDEFTVALRANVDEPSCRVQLGLSAMRAGRFDEAAQFLAEVSASLPLDTRVIGLRVMALRHAGREAEGKRILSPALRDYPTDYLLLSESRDARLDALLGGNAEGWIELAADYENAGRWDEALAILERAVRASSTKDHVPPMLDYHAALSCEHLGRAADAERHRARARRQRPEFVMPSRIEDAQALERALKARPSDSLAAFCLGHLYYARARRKEALALWHRALPAMKRSKLMHTVLALSSWEGLKYRETARRLRRAIRLDPDDVTLALWLDSALADAGDRSLRLRLLGKALAAHPEDDGLRERMAYFQFDRGRPREAINAIRDHRFKSRHVIYSLTLIHVMSHAALAEKEIERNRWGRAMELLDDAHRIPKNYGEDDTRIQFYGKIHYLAGLCCEKLGRRREAHAWYTKCVREDRPWLPELYYYDCLAYRRLGKPAEAKRAIEKMRRAIERMDKNPEARPVFRHFLRARYLLATGRAAEADREMRLARRLGWRPSSELSIWNRFGIS